MQKDHLTQATADELRKRIMWTVSAARKAEAIKLAVARRKCDAAFTPSDRSADIADAEARAFTLAKAAMETHEALLKYIENLTEKKEN